MSLGNSAKSWVYLHVCRPRQTLCFTQSLMNLKINEDLRFIKHFLSINHLSYRTFCFLWQLVLVVNFCIAGFDAGPKAFDPLLGSARVRVSRLLLLIVGLNVLNCWITIVPSWIATIIVTNEDLLISGQDCAGAYFCFVPWTKRNVRRAVFRPESHDAEWQRETVWRRACSFKV